jgi:hypothetical protein
MPVTTERTNVNVPRVMLRRARETWPETANLSVARVLRFALAKALGASDADALAATRDARFGTRRNSTETT